MSEVKVLGLDGLAQMRDKSRAELEYISQGWQRFAHDLSHDLAALYGGGQHSKEHARFEVNLAKLQAEFNDPKVRAAVQKALDEFDGGA